MKPRIDLHIHTTCSDGSLSPREVIDEAVRLEVNCIAIADHDTVEAYHEELIQYAHEKGIKLISAVEISTKIKKCGIHVLGYNIDVKNPTFLKELSTLRNARQVYLKQVAKKLEALGYQVDIDKLSKLETVTKAHIAKDIITKEQNKNQLEHDFGHLPNQGEFIEAIMNEGCPAYVEKKTVTPKEAAKMIRKAGGKVVLAHPVSYRYEDNLSPQEILEIIREMQADGIESNYIYIDKNQQKIDESDFWNQFAQTHHLKTTIGSDFHCKDNLHPEIGLIQENIHLSEPEIHNMLEFLEK